MRCVLPPNLLTVVVHKTVLKEFLSKTNDKTLNAEHKVPQPRNIEIKYKKISQSQNFSAESCRGV